MEPGTTLAAQAFKSVILLLFKNRIDNWRKETGPGRLDRLRTDWALEWSKDLSIAVERQAALLAETTEETDEKMRGLEQRLADHQFDRVFTNYAYEAAREAIDERRRMLAFLAAGSFNLEPMTLAQLARVERAVRELEPDDIVALANIAEAGGYLENRSGASASVDALTVDALTSAGCVRIEHSDIWDNPDGIVITRLAGLVLSVAQGYVNARREADASPAPRGDHEPGM